MSDGDQQHLRASFNAVAELYDRVRPGYPPELFDDLSELVEMKPGTRVLEIGPGTGQATLPLAERGCEIVAVELGADMAAVAQRNLARYPSVTIVASAFEDWPLPNEPFDVVISATAFHWIDPAARIGKVADARANLLACIAHLIDSHYGGRVRRRYLFQLQVAHRRRHQ